MLTATLHFILVFIATAAFLGVYRSYVKSGRTNQQLYNFSRFFAFLVFYQLFLSSYIFTKDLKMVSIFFNLGIFSLFLVLFYVLKTVLPMFSISQEKQNLLPKLLMFIGLVVVAWQFYDFRLPILHSSGFILWNPNPWPAWIISGVIVMVTTAWVFILSKNIKNFVGMAKTKNIFLILMSFVFGLSGIFYFHPNYYMTIAAFITHTLGFIFALITLIIKIPKIPAKT